MFQYLNGTQDQKEWSKMAKNKLTFRIWLLIVVLLLCLISIFGLPPTFSQEGVIVTSVGSNSTEFTQGLRQGQIITDIDGTKINDLEDFTKVIQDKFPSEEKVASSG